MIFYLTLLYLSIFDNNYAASRIKIRHILPAVNGTDDNSIKSIRKRPRRKGRPINPDGRRIMYRCRGTAMYIHRETGEPRYYARGRRIANKRIDTHVVLHTRPYNTGLHLVTIDAALRVRYARILFIPHVDYVETIMAGCRSSIFTDVIVNRLATRSERKYVPPIADSLIAVLVNCFLRERKNIFATREIARKQYAFFC